MSSPRAPTVRQRRLGAELRRLRELRDLTGDAVAESLDWSPSKISRIETARIGARASDVDRLLDLYGINGTQRDELVALVRDASQKGWWEDYPGLGAGYAEFIALESEASTAHQWENGVMPGLMQTEAYARHVVDGWNLFATLPPREIERRLEVRMRRQRVLHRPRPLELKVVLDESVLYRRIAEPEVMREQVELLCEIAAFPHVELRILALDGSHPVMAGPFTLLEFAPVHDVVFPDIVQTESLTFTHVEGETETHMYRLTHQALTDAALNPEKSHARLTQARDRWHQHP